MTFAEPIYLYSALLLIPALALLMVYANRRRHVVLARLGNPALVRRLGASVNWRGRRWKTGLWFASIVLVLFSLARPQWGEDVQVIERTGVQVMVALDVSESMLADDIKPNRLSRAKLEISDLMSRLGGDEVGLVLFSGASFIQFPLTSDYTTAQSFLDGARPGVISKPGTNIGDAIRTAMSGFDENSNSQRVIVLITDGEAHDAEAITAVQQAADEGVIFYTIGFGSPEGVPIPQTDAAGNVIGYKTDRNGETVLSRLDEETLRTIAATGNGQFFRASASGAELDALVDKLNQLQQGEIGSQLEVRRIERYQIFLALSLLTLVISMLIPDRVSNRKMAQRRNVMMGESLMPREKEVVA
jgi:Ca-activated chloride channel family protein